MKGDEENVREIIEADLAAEMGARALYREAAEHCLKVKDYPSRDLFELLMADEEGHIDFLETQLDVIERIGLERYTQAHIGVSVREAPRRTFSLCLLPRAGSSIPSRRLFRECRPTARPQLRTRYC